MPFASAMVSVLQDPTPHLYYGRSVSLHLHPHKGRLKAIFFHSSADPANFHPPPPSGAQQFLLQLLHLLPSSISNHGQTHVPLICLPICRIRGTILVSGGHGPYPKLYLRNIDECVPQCIYHRPHYFHYQFPSLTKMNFHHWAFPISTSPLLISPSLSYEMIYRLIL